MRQHGCASKTCQVKGARRKRAHTAFYMKLYSGEKITIVFASAGVEADWEGAWGNFLGLMVMFYTLTGVWVMQVFAFAKTQ